MGPWRGTVRVSADGAHAARSAPLLCALGWHKADALALWNDGYYFSNCDRCGQDLIRTAFGRWTVPRGFRVVWSAQPPQVRAPTRLSPDVEISARRTRIEFPIAEPAGIGGETDAADAPKMVEDAPVMFAPATTEPEAAEAEARDGSMIFLDLRKSARWARSAKASRLTEPARSDERRLATVGELPIQEVLRMLHDDEAPPQTRAAGGPVTLLPDSKHDDEPYLSRASPDAPPADTGPEEAQWRDDLSSEPEDEAGSITSLAARSAPDSEAVPSRLIIPDFMGEAPFEIAYDLRTGRIMSPEERRLAKAAAARRAPRTGGMREQLRDMRASARAYLHVRRASASMGKGLGKRLEELLRRHAGLAAATVFGAFVLTAALIERPAERSAPVGTGMTIAAKSASPAPQTLLDAPPTAPPAVDTAFVTASLLNCRAAPVENAATVRKLTRGAAVQLLSAEPGWASVAHRGRQCWVSARYLSAIRPL